MCAGCIHRSLAISNFVFGDNVSLCVYKYAHMVYVCVCLAYQPRPTLLHFHVRWIICQNHHLLAF